MENPNSIDLDTEEKHALWEALKTRIQNGDVTISQGCLGSGPGHWKPLLNVEREEAAMLTIFSRFAMGKVPTKIRETLMTGLLMAQDKDGKRVRPTIIPSFVSRASLSAIGAA